MRTKTKIILIMIPVILIGVISISVWFVYRRIVAPLRSSKEIPAELEEARVILGADLLSRSQFVRTNQLDSWRDIRDPAKLKGSLDSIEDIALGELDGNPGLDIGIAGRFGALLFDRQGNVKERNLYEFERKMVKLGPIESETEKGMLGDMQIVDIEGDGVCEYLGRGSIHGGAVFNHQGKVLWSYGDFTEEKTAIDNLTVGDVDGDGVAEFVASWEAIEVFDRHGTKRWAQEDEFSGQVEVVDVDGDGRNEILNQSGHGMMIRDSEGQVIKKVEMPIYIGRFTLCENHHEKKPPQILTVDSGSVWLIDFDGQTTAKFDAPLSHLVKPTPRVIDMPGMSEPVTITDEDVYKAEGVWVKLIKEQPAYLAIIAQFVVMDRSIFYVYDAQGKLVYQEILPEQCSSIAVLPSEDESRQPSLLVGGEETIWRYAAH